LTYDPRFQQLYSQTNPVIEEEKKLMEQYGITCEQRTVYFYQGYQYANLKDALNYARIDKERLSLPGRRLKVHLNCFRKMKSLFFG
jgi:hypothetical protein